MSMTSYFTFNIMHFENLHPCEELSMKSKWSKKIGDIVFLMSWARFTGFTLLKRLKLRLWKPAGFKSSLFHMDE